MGNRVEKAVELFKSGYNCAQSVFTAYADFYGIDKELALKLSSSFGGGIGGMHTMCGALCGLTMIVGLEIGLTVAEDSAKKKQNYQMVQKLADDFRKDTGSMLCKLALKPDDDVAPGIKRKPCVEYVRYCAELIDRNLI